MTHDRLLRFIPILLLALGMAPAAGLAAVPSTLGLDGALYATAGGPAPDGSYSFTFALYDSETGGSALWTEGPVSLEVANGSFRYALGSKKPLAPEILATGRWLAVAIGSDPEMPRTPLHSVAFAMRAGVAEAVDCSACLSGSVFKPSSITSDKVGFSYAIADSKGGSALKALDVQCTGCVSVAEIAFDADLDLKNRAIKGAGSITSVSTITAKEFVGDGSKLSGLALPQGSCPKGKAIVGLTSEGDIVCGTAVELSALPGDGIDEISNGLIHNQFVDSAASAKAVAILDNNPLGISDSIDMPDYGLAQKLTVSVELTNSDVSKIKVTLTDPAQATHLLYDGGATGTAIKTSYPDPTAAVSGDLTTWNNKNPKGIWKLQVHDSGYKDNKTDGELTKWSINIQTLSNKKVQVKGTLIVDGTIEVYGTCRGAQIAGVCLAAAGINGTFINAAKYCASYKADLCTDSQSWVLRRSGMLNSNANWTNSFADNDASAWSETNGGTGDDHSAGSNWQAPCCYNLTPQRATDQKVSGIRVVHVRNVQDTYFRNAAAFCVGLQADLCDKAQYTVIRKAGIVTVPVWSSDHSDNDPNTSASYEKGIGAVTTDPGIDSQYGFACCATDRANLACPGTDVQGVCVVKVNNSGGTWATATDDCAAAGARLCSMSQTAVLRAAGTVTHAASWTASYSDNDAGSAAVAVGNAGDDHVNTSSYGWACCL